MLGGKIGTGPFFKDIGGSGIALTMSAFTLIAFLSWDNVIVEMKLITVWLDLNLKFLIIFLPTFGVTDKKIQLHESTISWLFFFIVIFLNFLLSFWAVSIFLADTSIVLNNIFELQIPVITEDAIFPVPIKPNFIGFIISVI